MSTILVGRFQELTETERAITALEQAGFDRRSISSFYVTPHGRHDLHPIGDEREQSPGAKDSGTGTVAGGAAGAIVGAAIGLAGLPVLGPVAPVAGGLVGAHVAGLVGGLSSMKERGESEQGQENLVAPRHPGLLVAVTVSDTQAEQRALAVLRSVGAHELERTEGQIDDGDWVDFDPQALPALQIRQDQDGEP
ncbi:hypothetical protein [Actimicrobium antarcticum]|uniref:Glycine zipper domain-containing protein n=1 Tax=Actimicrobium antarcticum TaxID=1051899 RepID=A0ABP7U102_9BURK